MKIIIEIELGNDAMQSGNDVAVAVMETCTLSRIYTPLYDKDRGAVFDENGNRVGTWEVKL